LRFPIIEAALTPIGVIGGIRGVFFANMGGGWFNNQNFKFATSSTETTRSIVDFQRDATGAILLDPATQLPLPVYGPDKTISGFRLKDGRASYGLGLETFALGFPIHFDWSWRTLFNSSWEDQLYSAEGADAGTTGSKWFRQPRFAVWIGYDF
jgi:outer membrane protein assembly factor BamA